MGARFMKKSCTWWLSFLGMGLACAIFIEFALVFVWAAVMGSSGVTNPMGLVPVSLLAVTLGLISSYRLWPPETEKVAVSESEKG